MTIWSLRLWVRLFPFHAFEVYEHRLRLRSDKIAAAVSFSFQSKAFPEFRMLQAIRASLPSNAGNGHQALTAGPGYADGLDLRSRHFDPLVQSYPIVLKAGNQLAHAQGQLFTEAAENGWERVAQRNRTPPDSNTLFNQKGADLLQRCRPVQHEAGPNPV
ncbi:hypothetical protein ETW24_03555 [Leisingera sp. NJS204]|nr:hypothetical protein ETW24_03555 [Leisingera sp. NJS204]